MSTSAAWAPLPPRKKRSRSTLVGAQSSKKINCDEKTSEQSQIAEANEGKNSINHNLVRENVIARSKIVRAKATLDSLDGCAGEFYECNWI